MSESAIQEIKQWARLVTDMKALDESTFHPLQSLVNPDGNHLYAWVPADYPADHPAPLLFQDQVLPLFLGKKIESHDMLLRTSYPWLNEFHGQIPNDYPEASQQFQRNPESMLKVLWAYGSLMSFVKAKQTLATGLRLYIDAWISGQYRLEGEPNYERTTRERYQKLRSVIDDEVFIQEVVFSDLAVVYTEFVAIWTYSSHPPSNETTAYRSVLAKVRQFAELLPPASSIAAPTGEIDFRACLLTIRTKSLTHLSESKEQYMNARIETLQLEKGKLEDELRIYKRAISDLGFRHLTEKLPISAGSAGGSSTARWQTFWGHVWNHSGAGPKVGTPLRTLWDRSDDRTRKSIRGAGEKLFSVLSENIHGFDRAYDPQDAQRDKSQGDILKSLRPLEANTTGEDVDWAKECIRWV